MNRITFIFNAPETPCRIWLQQANKIQEIILPAANQYSLQCDAFSKAILEQRPVPTPLEDAISNIKVIESLNNADIG